MPVTFDHATELILAFVTALFAIVNVPPAEILASPDIMPLSAVATCDPVKLIAVQVT